MFFVKNWFYIRVSQKWTTFPPHRQPWKECIVRYYIIDPWIKSVACDWTRFTLNAHDSLLSLSHSPSLLLAASRTRNASRWYRELVRIKGDNKGEGNETVVSERNEDRAISYRTPSARKQFIPLRCSTLIRPTFFFHFSDPVPSLAEIFWSRLLRSPAPHVAYELWVKAIFL